jgi:predicted site-specific integrase-resolvase
MIDKDKPLIKLRVASKMLGIQVRTLREWIKLGKIKAVKLDGCPMWFISTEEIERKIRG